MSSTRQNGSFLGQTVVVFIVALALNFSVAMKLGMVQPMTGDAFYFLSTAKSLAKGEGYVLKDGFWPNAPTMRQMPGWPFVVSVALRMTGGVIPDVIMRCISLVINSLVAVSIFLLTFMLFKQQWPAMIAGLAYAIYPSALFLAYSGYSETLFILLVTAGLLMMRGTQLWRYLAFLVLGSACLVRGNFLLWLVFAAIGWFFHITMRKKRTGQNLSFWRCGNGRGLISILCITLFIFPTLLWTIRNYEVSGRYPVVSTLWGQTFYGTQCFS